jgi:fructokinase
VTLRPGTGAGRTTGFLVVGECVADIVRTPGRPDRAHPGGSPANVAYGLARLGRPATLLTQLGEDPMGDLLRAHLTGAGVRVVTDGCRGRPTPTAIVRLDGAGAATYDFAVGWTLRPVDVAIPGHVHLGSIASVTEPGATTARALLRAARAAAATVSYDPNVRPALFGDRARAVASVEECVALSDVVKASDEDLAWLYPGAAPGEAARRWLGLGPAAVLVTRGGAGALALTAEGETLAAEAVPAVVVDTVGAGDSFMSATLDALAARGLLGRGARRALASIGAPALREVLAHAATAAALTVSRAGAHPPTAAELAEAAPRR